MNIEMPRKKLDLSSAIAEGDIRVLLMVLVHMTGDERWLEPPYKPRRDVRLIPDPAGRPAPEIQDEIRAAVLKLFANGEPKPVITDPGNELMLRMMRATLGENVAPEYAPLMREEMGFVPREARWSKRPPDEKLAQQHVLIVGAGVCAIALGVALGRLGIPYTIVEKNAELGGTWYVNRYPGCGVDTPNHSYSFSFGARNPWTRYFAQRQELLDYLKKVALEYDIRKHLRLNTELTSSRWDESKRRWISTLKTANGEETFESTTLVSAIGQLNDPSPAHFKGEEDFKGQTLHSALWSDDIKLDGKHVAVIGTGATAMQLVPSIADRVASVTVYQRTAQWARPVAGYSDPDQRRRAMAARASAVLRAVVSLQHVLALRRRPAAVPAQGPELAASRSRRQQGQRPASRGTDGFHPVRIEGPSRPDREMRPDLSALRQAHPARQQLVQDADQAECRTGHRQDRPFRAATASSPRTAKCGPPTSS